MSASETDEEGDVSTSDVPSMAPPLQIQAPHPTEDDEIDSTPPEIRFMRRPVLGIDVTPTIREEEGDGSDSEDEGAGMEDGDSDGSEEERIFPAVDLSFRAQLILGGGQFFDADREVDYSKDIQKEVWLEKIVCGLNTDTISTIAMYNLTRFRTRSENTNIFRTLLFILYSEKSATTVNPEHLAKYTNLNKKWVPKRDEILLPPVAIEACNIKNAIPERGMLELALQQLIELARTMRLKGEANFDHDIVGDAEMYFHHIDYIRVVVLRIVNPTTLIIPHIIKKGATEDLCAFLIAMTGKISLDEQGKLLRRIWYENYISPIEVEANVAVVGMDSNMQAQRVFAHIRAKDINVVNRTLSNPVHRLIILRTDMVHHTGLIVAFVGWVESATQKALAPQIHTLHTVRDAPIWSFVFMYELLFYVNAQRAIVGPFRTAAVCMRFWISQLRATGPSKKLRKFARGIFERSFAVAVDEGFTKQKMTEFFLLKRPYDGIAGGFNIGKKPAAPKKAVTGGAHEEGAAEEGAGPAK